MRTWSADKSDNLRFGLLLAFLAACFLWGGASRLDITGLIFLQPLAIVVVAAILVIPGPIRWSAVRIPLLLLGSLAGIMLIQLIPLPPSVWAQLPGHGAFAQTAVISGVDEAWRPISLTPDLTLASLVGLVVPFAVLIGFASISVERTYRILPYLLIGSGLSAFLGLAQIAGGPQSPFYLYSVTNNQLPVGFFANRNHQAVLLAMTWPMLALWVSLPSEKPSFDAARKWIAAAFAIFLLPMLVITGSRAGLFLGLIALGFGLWQWRRRQSKQAFQPGRWERLALPFALLITLVVVVVAIGSARDEAVRRVLGLSVTDDPRLEFTPTLIQLARDFFPVGSGFGSFDPIFRYYEPLEVLRASYLNHAHNDLLELVITAGLPGLLVLLSFLAWMSIRWLSLARSAHRSRGAGFGRLAAAMIVLLLLSSIVDYPLRTPLASVLFAFACGWLGSYSRERRIVPDLSSAQKNFTYE